ncbi:MAG: hypothetical protein FD123_21 [Bacteroidetes bacterium]|nr:MAG: hypothetical protein FD123_21 [Bacteroidota bacterium]
MPVLFNACGDKKGTEQVDETIPAGMMALDLTPYGFPLKINIPDSTANMGKLEVSEGESWGGVSIRIGKTFQLNINVGDEESTNLKMQKELLAATDAGECTYTTESDSLLVYVTKFGEEVKRNHFYQVIKIGTEKYVIRDINDPENEFLEDHIKKMMESAKTLRNNPKPAAEPKS